MSIKRALLLLLTLSSSSLGQSIPAPPSGASPFLLDGASQDSSESVWVPMADTFPVSRESIQGRFVLVMPCLFGKQSHERASWDRSLRVDLTSWQGISFHIYAENLSAISRLNLYLRSGHGWYIVPFHIPSEKTWHPILIRKEEMGTEEAPDGWGTVDTLRLSAWRAKPENARLCLCNVGFFGKESDIALLRGESYLRSDPKAGKTLCQYAQVVASGLRDMGLSYHLMSDLDALRGHLQGKRLAVLPYNPSMPEPVLDQLIDFTNKGGKLLSFYTLPPRLREVVHMGGGQHIQAPSPGAFAQIVPVPSSLPQAPPLVRQRSWNINECTPVEGKSEVLAWWHDSQGVRSSYAAAVGSDPCVHMTHVLLPDFPQEMKGLLMGLVDKLLPGTARHAAPRLVNSLFQFEELEGSIQGQDKAVERMREGRQMKKKSQDLLKSSRYGEALACAAEGRRYLVEGYCLAQTPVYGEHRAFWCHSPLGVEGMSWEEAVKKLSDNGFNVLLPNMLWAGVAYYDSHLLPTAPEVAERGDLLGQCLLACKRHGVDCHVWKVNFNMGSKAPEAFQSKMKEEGRIQILFNGNPEPEWLCPSHPENQELEVESMLELVRRYDVDGIHFDYIRYPHRDSCFCPGCRKRFETWLGKRTEDWPASVRQNPELHQAWMRFRREQITSVVRRVHKKAKSIRPDIQISAAVFRDWPLDRDKVGQDWKLWCEEGLLDFVCPMDYTPDLAQFQDWIRRQKAWAGQVPCYPGIGYSTWGANADVVRLIQQILLTRKHAMGGFTIFNYGTHEARDILPLCSLGATSKGYSLSAQ